MKKKQRRLLKDYFKSIDGTMRDPDYTSPGGRLYWKINWPGLVGLWFWLDPPTIKVCGDPRQERVE